MYNINIYIRSACPTKFGFVRDLRTTLRIWGLPVPCLQAKNTLKTCHPHPRGVGSGSADPRMRDRNPSTLKRRSKTMQLPCRPTKPDLFPLKRPTTSYNSCVFIWISDAFLVQSFRSSNQIHNAGPNDSQLCTGTRACSDGTGTNPCKQHVSNMKNSTAQLSTTHAL